MNNSQICVGALLDTGAAISCIDSSVVNNRDIVPLNKNLVLRAATGTQLNIIGGTIVDLCVNNYCLKVYCIVINKLSTNIILGTNFLREYGVIINYNSEQIIIQKINTIFEFAECRLDTYESNISKQTLRFFEERTTNVGHIFHTSASTEKGFNVNNGLERNQRIRLSTMCEKYRQCFAFNNNELGKCNFDKLTINTTDNIPVHKPPYRVSPKQREIIEEQVDEMLRDGIIRESKSPYAAPVVLVKKKDESWRFCIDYRALNKKVIMDSYPMPRIDDLLGYLEGARYFASLDLMSGYWQIPIQEKDKGKTAFITSSGLYEFNYLPFGIKSGGAVFQRVMNKLLAGLMYKCAIVYLDDILVFGRTFEEFVNNLNLVFKRIKDANMTLKPQKCEFGMTEVNILGNRVSIEGVLPSEKNIECIINFPTPKKVRDVRSFLGLASFYRKHIVDFAKKTVPLSKLIRKDSIFKWGEEQQICFENLKKQLSSPPVLKHFSNDPNLITRIHVDASDLAVGAELSQGDEIQGFNPIAFASRQISNNEKHYSVSEKECLALMWALEYFKQFIWGRKVQVITDHKALCWLKSSKDTNVRLARWSLKIQDYDIEIKHKSGSQNKVADCLSRITSGTCQTKDNSDVPTYSIQWSEISLKNAQVGDPFCAKWISRLSSDSTTKSKGFCLREGILLKKGKLLDKPHDLIVLPEILLNNVLFEAHDDALSGGHFGLAKTLDKIRRKYYYPNIYNVVEKYVKSCIVCQQKKKIIGKPQGELIPIKVGKIFEKIGIDVIGPLTKSISGDRYIITCMDYASKYAETKACKQITAKDIAVFLVENIFCKHGVVKEIVTDRGSVFTSKIIQELMKILGSRSCLTSSFHPASNGLVERFNGTLIRSLSMYVRADQKDWCSFLPLVTFAYNIAVQSSIQVSPFVMIYGRTPCLASDLMKDIQSNPSDLLLTEKMKFIEEISKFASENISKVQKKQKEGYDKKHTKVSFIPNQLVLLHNPSKIIGKSPKLDRQFKGPFRILEQTSPVNYKIKLVGETKRKIKKSLIVHVDRLKPFFYRT